MMIRILKEGEVPISEILERSETITGVEGTVADIIADVKENGDRALIAYAEKFDGACLKSLMVTEEEIEEAFRATEDKFIRILKEAAANIEEYHKRQLRSGFEFSGSEGALTGQKVIPVDRAGIYVPGGTAAYPSTVLMNAVPARIAGVGEIIMTTPPSSDGKIAPQILAAAKVAGVTKIFKTGGAQAVAAMAYGTESIPKCDKIVGPGNAYVAEAKRQVYGRVSIDMIAGPSEILVIADGKSDPVNVAADMLSQAEHDRMATAVLITESEELAGKVAEEIDRQLETLPRKEIASASVENNGKIIVTDSLERAAEISNELAPEHLELCTDDPFALLPKIKHAGSVFMGRYCPEALGDYLAGPNHTLPTSGTAKFASPLSVDDFIKKMQYTCYTEDALKKVADDIAYFAEKEGLSAHARSATVRFREKE